MRIENEDENVFGWLGLKENPDSYQSATGVYDYFWEISQETRDKIINGWIDSLRAYLDPEVAVLMESATGTCYVSVSDNPVEDKPAGDNIIQFPRLYDNTDI